ncbi:uncharacterized protein LOC126204361 [Schistocerca nitens]|uniref:uncharacterized protein LOC126204361 n=1 Tax=Schistocerca nitens TaxID=7011 RepID=UPI0021191C52|nr:uncharacterized protein LOC126204361 [Schistocerca nitens]
MYLDVFIVNINTIGRRFHTSRGLHLNGLGKQLVTLKLMEIIKRLQHLPTSSAGVPVSSPQKVSPGMTNAESDTETENAAEVPKAAILTAVESTAASEEPPSVTAEVAPPATTPSPSPAAAEETPSATAEAAPPAVEPVPIAAAPSPTPVVAEPTALPVIAGRIPPPPATRPTSPPVETEPAPPPSSSGLAEKNRPVTVSKVSSLSHDEVYQMIWENMFV